MLAERDHNRSEDDLRAAVRDRLYQMSSLNDRCPLSELRQQTASLQQEADAAGYRVVSGLARALADDLNHFGADCLPVYFAYLARSLTLEPCTRDVDAILSLLLAGVRRRLAATQPLMTA